MIIKTISIILPILTIIIIGMLCKKNKILSNDGLDGIRSIVSNILLPIVLFNAFFTASYSIRMLIVFITSFIGFAIAFGLGFLFKGIVKPYDKYFPFLVTSSEVGMLGYALFALIAGEGSTSTLAIVDIGQTIFAYSIWITTLKAIDGSKMSIKDIVSNFIHTKPAMGMLIGIILGLLGIGDFILSSNLSLIYTQLVSFITAPTGVLILIIVGYDLQFNKSLIKPICITSFMRVLFMGIMCFICSIIIFSITPFDKTLMMALILTCSLPAPFIIPLFSDTKLDGPYVSASYSLETIVTIILLVPLIIYSLI